MTEFQFDLDAYLRRVGLASAPSPPDLAALTAVMAAQSRAIAFENLDVVLGRVPVDIAPAAVAAKLVAGGRGGYCFEQNTLLKLALEALGFDDVRFMLCRVRFGKAYEQDTPYTHLALRVSLGGAGAYLADVGFAGTNSMAPARLGDAAPQPLPEGLFRARPAGAGGAEARAGAGFVVLERQLAGEAEWKALYMFRPDETAIDADIAVANFWSCAHRSARFTNQLFVSRVLAGADGDERHHWLDGEHTRRAADGAATREAVADGPHVGRLLGDVFGIRLSPGEIGGICAYLRLGTEI